MANYITYIFLKLDCGEKGDNPRILGFGVIKFLAEDVVKKKHLKLHYIH